MENKQAKPKNKILKFLPRAASAVAVSFQNPPFSPGRAHHHAGRGFSGPIIPMIPDEARRKPRNKSFETRDQEPTSPKVSCMGQIKHKHKQKQKIKKNKRPSPPQEVMPVASSSPREVKKHASGFRRLFSGVKIDRKSEVSGEHHKPPLPDKAPSLSQMNRFASGRSDSLANFDWTAQIAPVDRDHRNYYSDEERGESDQEEEEEVIIPFSAPMTVGGGVPLQPKKEVNLWKRRTMAPPRPLQLKTVIKAN